VLDLIEAEGRSLRRAVMRLGVGLGLLMVAAAVAVAGLLLVVAAVYLGLEPQVGPAWAALIVGMLLLFGSGGLLWIAHRVSR
jgi:hypothetical protein